MPSASASALRPATASRLYGSDMFGPTPQLLLSFCMINAKLRVILASETSSCFLTKLHYCDLCGYDGLSVLRRAYPLFYSRKPSKMVQVKDVNSLSQSFTSCHGPSSQGVGYEHCYSDFWVP